jgi:hypothetical protein
MRFHYVSRNNSTPLPLPHCCFRLVMLLILVSPAAVLGESAAQPKRLALSDGFNNRDLSISPDGTMLATTLMAPRNTFSAILLYANTSGSWQDAAVAPFSGRFSDIEPMFSPDGKRLYFASKRPHLNNKGDNWDIWRVSFSNGTFGEPEVLPEPVNTENDEFYPTVTLDDVLYFTSARPGSLGNEDIFRATPHANGYAVENAGAGVNSTAWEFNSFVSAEDDYILFSSQGRSDDLGGGDLYVSFRNDNGEFDPARNLGPTINSSRLDYNPGVYRDVLYFTSERIDLTAPAAIQLNVEALKALKALFGSAGNGMGDLYSVPWQSSSLE